MFDTRPLSDEPSFMGDLMPDQYVSLSAVLNFHYAKKHGYTFSFVHMDEATMRQNFSVPWHRVFYFADRLTKDTQVYIREASDQCKWYLYLDTDAFVRDASTSLPAFIGDLAARYPIPEDVGAIFAQEQTHSPEMTFTFHAVSAGVYLVRANAHSRYYTRLTKKHARLKKHLLRIWRWST
mmetsp:Transcript_113927/g.362276  ORF Transcript_113927/g.362276 Transcript_113927/m.362276 type:complete len:180 (+) Transcript_113927:36-575(+)